MVLRDADYGILLDYIDGKLTDAERLSFEIRLTNEPDLASEFESFDKLDRIQRAASHHRPARSLRRVFAPLALSLAAAGLIIWIRITPRESSELRVAVLATSPSLLEHHHRELSLQGDLARTVPSNYGLRGDAGLTVVPDESYLELMESAEQTWIESGLSSNTRMVEAGLFVIPVELAAPSSVLVLLRAENGSVLGPSGQIGAAWPTNEVWTESTGRLPAGVHVLPSPPVSRRANGLVYDGGFVVPLKSGKLEVLIAAREEPFDENFRIMLGSALSLSAQGTTNDALEHWLASSGFTMRRVKVVEPTDG